MGVPAYTLYTVLKHSLLSLEILCAWPTESLIIEVSDQKNQIEIFFTYSFNYGLDINSQSLQLFYIAC